MSAGAFIRSRYQANNDEVHPIRIQPETETLIIQGLPNEPPAVLPTQKIYAKVSGGKREFCLTPRSVTIVFNDIDPPGGYLDNSPIKLPILTQTVWDQILPGATGTYLGKTIEVVSRSPEYPI